MTDDEPFARYLMTPEQHRRMAVALRRELPDHPETAFLVAAHEQIANAQEMEARRAREG